MKEIVDLSTTDWHDSRDEPDYSISRVPPYTGSPTDRKNHLRATLSARMSSAARSQAMNDKRPDYKVERGGSSRSPLRAQYNRSPPIKYRSMSAEFDVFRAKRRRRMRSSSSRSPRRELSSSPSNRIHHQHRHASPTKHVPFLLSTKLPDLLNDPVIYARSRSNSRGRTSGTKLMSDIGTMPPTSLQEGILLSELLNGKNDAYYGGDLNLVKISRGKIYSSSDFNADKFDRNSVRYSSPHPIKNAKPDWTTIHSPMSANRNHNHNRSGGSNHTSHSNSPHSPDLFDSNRFKSQNQNRSVNSATRFISADNNTTLEIQNRLNSAKGLFSMGASVEERSKQEGKITDRTIIIPDSIIDNDSPISNKNSIDTPYKHWSQSDSIGTPMATDLGSAFQNVTAIAGSRKLSISPPNLVSDGVLKVPSKDKEEKDGKDKEGKDGKDGSKNKAVKAISPTNSATGSVSSTSSSPKGATSTKTSPVSTARTAATVSTTGSPQSTPKKPPLSPTTGKAAKLDPLVAPTSPSSTSTLKSKAAVPTRASIIAGKTEKNILEEKKEEPLKVEIFDEIKIENIKESTGYSPPILVPPRRLVLPYQG